LKEPVPSGLRCKVARPHAFQEGLQLLAVHHAK
jgi:hypothetical protein